jgi:predicted glycoside hydrolase/deacetylase ChbG (UPF0249 family)
MAVDSATYLIVNADDFGQSASINRGVLEAHTRGIVTSASLMVRWPAAGAAADAARRYPGLGLGLHLDFGEWYFRDGAWVALYEVIPAATAEAVAAEVTRQLAAFRRLTGGDPTHLDSHQHVHRREPVRSVLLAMAGELSVPLRDYTPAVRYCSRFYGQTRGGGSLPPAVGVDALLALLGEMSPGVTELSCHPADGMDLPSMYGPERAEELRTLCDPRVLAAVAARGILLRSFADRPWEGGAPVKATKMG